MEKKNTVIAMIILAVIVISIILFIIFSGVTARDYNYVQLEINPRIEFICDQNFKVVSLRPLNDDGSVVVAGENYKGMDIADACVHYIDLSARLGFIDVDDTDNAINITVIDGISQSLDVHIVEEVYKYLKKNELLCTVVETNEDRSMFDEKKKLGLCCANKYKLITTINEVHPNLTIDSLKKMNELNLISMVASDHMTSGYTITGKQIEKKAELLSANADKYNTHKSRISSATQKSFEKKFSSYQNTTGEKYRTNFRQEYTLWHKQYEL